MEEQEEAAEVTPVQVQPADLLSHAKLDTKLKGCLTEYFCVLGTVYAAEQLQVLCFECLHPSPPLPHLWLAVRSE